MKLIGSISHVRKHSKNDDETITDRIEFNVDKRTKIENAFITKLYSLPTEGIGNNQGAATPTGDQSALGTIEDILIIDGFISKRNGDDNDGNNFYLATLKLWETDTKEVDDVWELGRMGIVVEDNHNADLIPKRTGDDQFAYLWERIEYRTDFKGNRELFKLFLRLNRGDGT